MREQSCIFLGILCTWRKPKTSQAKTSGKDPNSSVNFQNYFMIKCEWLRVSQQKLSLWFLMFSWESEALIITRWGAGVSGRNSSTKFFKSSFKFHVVFALISTRIVWISAVLSISFHNFPFEIIALLIPATSTTKLIRWALLTKGS